MSLNELAISIWNYKNQDTWNESTYLKEESFNHLQEIMVAAGELKDYAPYNDLVINYSDSWSLRMWQIHNIINTF